MKISKNFWLSELTNSSTAERYGGEMLKQQDSPSAEVIESLKYHIIKTVQPARDYLGCGITINSGYRGQLLNDHLGSNDQSEHLPGMATDQVLSNSFSDIISVSVADLFRVIVAITGREPRSNTNSNYALWAYYCLNLHVLDINQVIHEYGSDGAPKWIHASSSKVKDKRQILIKRSGEGYIELTLKEALMLGC